MIRKVVPKDVEGIRKVITSSGLFPPEELDAMIADYLGNTTSDEIWFTKVLDGHHVAVCYCAPEKFTEGTYNLYAIGVLEERQGHGIGTEMMTFIEELLRKKSQRILIVETSSDPALEATRKFYERLNYNHEATIRDFWQEGEDKIIYWKKL